MGWRWWRGSALTAVIIVIIHFTILKSKMKKITICHLNIGKIENFVDVSERWHLNSNNEQIMVHLCLQRFYLAKFDKAD